MKPDPGDQREETLESSSLNRFCLVVVKKVMLNPEFYLQDFRKEVDVFATE